MQIGRRALLASAAAASFVRPVAAQTTGVTPVFIRWDAWYHTAASVSPYHAMLSPQRWQSRAPWFSQVVSPHRIISAGTQVDMDLEILAAQNAGIKAWAWCWYHPGTGSPASPLGSIGLSAGWNLYNTSPNKNLVKWCMFLQGPHDVGYEPWSNTAGWHANVDQMVTFLQQPNYLKVLGRPVIFILWGGTESVAEFFAGSTANVTTAFNYLRTQCAAVPGLGAPYIVACGSPWPAMGSAGSSSAVKTIVTGDAISHYAPALLTPTVPSTAADMYATTQAGWASQLASGSKVVPNVITGWDTRPINENPTATHPKAWLGNLQYFAHPTNAEVANYLQGAINFIGANLVACESKMMLVYSWSEQAEGGKGAIPTIGDPPTGTPPTTNLLNAIKPVLTAAA